MPSSFQIHGGELEGWLRGCGLACLHTGRGVAGWWALGNDEHGSGGARGGGLGEGGLGHRPPVRQPADAAACRANAAANQRRRRRQPAQPPPPPL